MNPDPKELVDRTVGEVLAENYRRARVFRRHDIDFCCGGNRSLAEVCEERDLAPDSLARELVGVGSGKDSSGLSFEGMQSLELIDYVQENHHEYTEEAIARISGYMDKVRTVHGESHPEIGELRDLWVELGPEMLQHMRREDRVLFPYARELFESDGTGAELEGADTAEELIGSMGGEHDETGDRLYTIQDLTDDFTPPGDACTTFRALYSDLEEFVEVTMEHVFVEESVLFPRIVEREQPVT